MARRAGPLRARSRRARRGSRQRSAPTASTSSSSRPGPSSGGWSPTRSRTASCADTRRRCPNAGCRGPPCRASWPRSAASTLTSSRSARRDRTPPSCCRTRSATRDCRGCWGATRSSRSWTGFRRGPRSRSAIGRCSSSPTRAGCAATRSSSSTSADVDFDAEAARVTGKGGKTRMVPIGEPAQRALDRYLTAARPRSSSTGRRRGAVPVAPRPAAVAVGRAAAAAGWVREAALAGGVSRTASPLVRDPPAGGRRRPALDPGAARARERVDDPGLHAGRAVAPAAPVCAGPSPGVDGGMHDWRRKPTVVGALVDNV